jgi:succinoglycan biosynthesis protein ExoW
MIAVIIPFYQRQAGLLRRAVQSVMAQNGNIPWRIIVVDDGSPTSARQDLEGLEGLPEERLTVVRQENRGVSAARNRGLDQAGPDPEVVAFLDSDDAWEEGHLERIAVAMSAGADFYFDNYRRYDGLQPALDSAVNWKSCRQFEPLKDLHWFEGDLFDALLKGSPARTSTVAYRFGRMAHLRFQESLWYCEDILFWMEISMKARRVALSPRLGAFCGKGVNISEHDWGTLGEVRHHLGMSRYLQSVRSRFLLTKEQDLWCRNALREFDMNIWLSTFAAGARGRYAGAGLALSHVATRPQAMSIFPAAMARAAHTRLSRIFIPRA